MEIINNTQKEIIGVFFTVSDSEHFYLSGGTALAYFYLKHRRSNDLDFFTAEEELVLPVSYHLEKALKVKKMDIQRHREVHSFVELLVKTKDETTIVHLGCDAAFRLEQVKEFPDHPGLKVDSLVDIAVNKLLALFGRATLRDFIDVYFLIRQAKFTCEELMDKAKMKDPGFDLYWLGIALERINTFKEDSAEMLLLVEPVDFKEMLVFFNSWRQKISKELL
ncbi:MAG: nucleotidyl transferase AbiEii/AbiGii toxin family protein [Candidatus Omnitrophica bacterium]|nr:nucleotidyl transferase AbiEii/AbiGii toxin family protein [Candidatus Omnitrophota bacterium]